MLDLTNLIGFGVGARQKEAKFIDSRSNATRLTTQSFSGVALGDPDQNRLIVLTIGMEQGGVGAEVVSVLIGGVSATVLDTAGASGWGNCAMAYAVVPAGTTSTISITFNNPCSVGVGVYSVYGLDTPTHAATARSTASASFTLPAQVGDMVIVTATQPGGVPPTFNIGASDYSLSIGVIGCAGAHSVATSTSVGVTPSGHEEAMGCTFR